MSLCKTGQIQNCCQPNALITLKEFLTDYATEETKKIGEDFILKELDLIENESVKKESVSSSENVPNMAYWGSVLDNAEKTAKNGRNLNTIYTLLSDALGVIKTAMGQPV